MKISRLNIDPTSFYFTLNKRSSKAFIHLTFIIYYISQKRSRILTLINQYFYTLRKSLQNTSASSYLQPLSCALSSLYLVCSLIFIVYLNTKHPETSGCHSYIKYKIARVRRLARSPTPQKKKSTFHSLQGFPLPDNPPSSKW